MIAIVYGGRNFTDRDAAFKALDEARILLGLTKVACPGDLLVVHWARERDLPCSVYGIDWHQHGVEAAELICIQEMLEHSGAGAVLAFPGGSGTADMCRRAAAAGLPVYEFTPDKKENDQ